MPIDLMIPFGILLVLVIYLIYTRSKFEKDVVNIYEKKFEEWKSTTSFSQKEEIVHKELVGLVFKEGHKTSIELLNPSIKSKLEKGKFKIYDIKSKVDENE